MDFWQNKAGSSPDSSIQGAISKIEDELVIAMLVSLLDTDEAVKKQNERFFRALVKRGVPARVILECLVEAAKEEE